MDSRPLDGLPSAGGRARAMLLPTRRAIAANVAASQGCEIVLGAIPGIR